MKKELLSIFVSFCIIIISLLIFKKNVPLCRFIIPIGVLFIDLFAVRGIRKIL